MTPKESLLILSSYLPSQETQLTSQMRINTSALGRCKGEWCPFRGMSLDFKTLTSREAR